VFGWAELLPAISMDRFALAQPALGLEFETQAIQPAARWFVSNVPENAANGVIKTGVKAARDLIRASAGSKTLARLDRFVAADFSFDPPEGNGYSTWMMVLEGPIQSGDPPLPFEPDTSRRIRDEFMRLYSWSDLYDLLDLDSQEPLSDWDRQLVSTRESTPLTWIQGTIALRAFRELWPFIHDLVGEVGAGALVAWGRERIKSMGQAPVLEPPNYPHSTRQGT
jgi:hypothetical protein